MNLLFALQDVCNYASTSVKQDVKSVFQYSEIVKALNCKVSDVFHPLKNVLFLFCLQLLESTCDFIVDELISIGFFI